MTVPSFDSVVDAYDAARPTYPEGVYDALGPLGGLRVVEGGAGTGMGRVLRDGGRWAGWWNHGRADGEPWFEAYFDVLESMTGAQRWHRDTDWGATLDPELFDTPVFTSVPWVREVPIDVWLTDERSKSNIGMVPHREEVIASIESIVRDEFGDGPVRVRCETWLWQATRR